jgi:capsular exopolysaccharide synthesis family protein
MDLQQYLHALRTYWWVVALPVVVGLGFGLFTASRAEPEYRASVTFFVATSGEQGAQSAVQGDEFAQRRVNSYVELLSTDSLANKVIDASGLPLTPGQVKAMIGADSDIETVLLTATVTHESQEIVTRVAEAVSTQFVDLVDEVENQGIGPASVQLEVVSGPNVRELPPRRTLAVGIPAVVGLVAGLALAWLLEVRDKTIRSEAQLRALNPVPVLGMIPFDRRLREAPRSRHVAVSSAGIESFRQLRTNLEFIDVGSPVQVLVVTSSVADEGKTTTATNLASALAAADRKVLIVEADLRRPTLDEYFKVGRSAGLTDVIVGRAEIDATLKHVGFNGVMLLPSGQPAPNPSELVGGNAMVQLLESLRERFDTVIINTPPLLPVTDAAVLSAHADGVVVVVRSGKTTRHQLALAMRSLQAVGARILGTVLNLAPAHRGSGYAAYWHTAAPESDRSGMELELPRNGSDREAVTESGDERVRREAPDNGKPPVTPAAFTDDAGQERHGL